jgi:vancomycin resistance protein VanJ
VVRVGVAYAAAVAGILIVGFLVRVDGGPLSVAGILSPHLALASVLLVPLAALARSRVLAAALALVAVLFVGRFGSEWTSPGPVLSIRDTVDVATWNVESGALAGLDAVAVLFAHPVDIVVLQELTPAVAEAIAADTVLTARWPHRALFPTPGVAGIGLLSAFPIRDPVYQTHPVRLEARVALDDGDLVVLGAHPFPARIGLLLGVPVGLDPAERNADLELLRSRVVELDAQGERVLLIGDFNTAPTEPAFALLTGGLHDAHANVGEGPGWTWRPRRLAFLGIGLLRIDLVLSTSGLQPLGTSVDCPRTGDHCLLEATLER